MASARAALAGVIFSPSVARCSRLLLLQTLLAGVRLSQGLVVAGVAIAGVLKFQVPRNINAGSAIGTPRDFPPFRRTLELFLTDRWRKCEAKLNAIPQFMTEIDGLNIHFIHVRSKHENAFGLNARHHLSKSG